MNYTKNTSFDMINQIFNKSILEANIDKNDIEKNAYAEAFFYGGAFAVCVSLLFFSETQKDIPLKDHFNELFEKIALVMEPTK